MAYTPIDILDYVLDNNKDADFMLAMSMHKMGYSIGEIPDVKFEWNNDKMSILSKAYNLNREVTDLDIMIANKAGKYISAFISRFGEMYQIHFLVHDYMVEEKSSHEEEIAERVVQYMILKTIKQLRLDTPDKVENFMKV